LPKFYLKISEAMINITFNGSDKEQEKTESLRLNATLKPIDISSILISFLINLLDYYPNFLIQHFISKYFERTFEFLKGLLRKVILELNLEILDFIELHKAYPPIHFELRSVLEQQIKKEFDIKEINQLTLGHLSKLMSFETNVLNNVIDPDIINLNDLVGEFEIYHILWSIGPYIFSKTSASQNISVINLYDLLGRRIS